MRQTTRPAAVDAPVPTAALESRAAVPTVGVVPFRKLVVRKPVAAARTRQLRRCVLLGPRQRPHNTTAAHGSPVGPATSAGVPRRPASAGALPGVGSILEN